MRLITLAITLLASSGVALADPLPLTPQTQAIFDAVRDAALELPEAKTAEATIRGVEAKGSTSDKAWAELMIQAEWKTQWISQGLLAALESRAEGQAEGFQTRVLGLILARQLSELWTLGAGNCDREAVRLLARTKLGTPSEAEVRVAVELLDESRGLVLECQPGFLDIGPMQCDFVPRWKVVTRYGPASLQVYRLRQAIAKAPAEPTGMSAAVSR